MAVHTPLTTAEIQGILSHYDQGELVQAQGIDAGTENTNYFIDTSKPGGHFVLSLFEELSGEQLSFIIELMLLLHEADIPVPHPIRARDKNYMLQAKGRPVILCERLNGDHPEAVSLAQASAMGNMLAQLHLTAANINQRYEGTRDTDWFEHCINRASQWLDKDEIRDIERVFQQYHACIQNKAIPDGIIHGDLFRDNVMFEGDTLTGILDLYSAGEGLLLYDLAITLNDWCSQADGSINAELSAAMISAYESLRPLTDIEKINWGIIQQTAALRFWLSRLVMQKESGGQGKDPEEYKRIFYGLLN